MNSTPTLAVSESFLGVAYSTQGLLRFIESVNDGQSWGEATVLSDNVEDATPSISTWEDHFVVAYSEPGLGVVVKRTTGYAGPAITVVSPNGGEWMAAGSSHDITWTADPAIQNFEILLSVDGGESWATVEPSVPNIGSYSWLVPDEYSPNCLVKLVNTANEWEYDISDNPFGITMPGMPVAVYSLDGDTADESGNGHDGENHGVSWEVCATAESDLGGVFTASEGDYISVADHPDFDIGTGPWAASLWIKHQSVDTHQYYLVKRRDDGQNNSYCGLICKTHVVNGSPRFTLQSGEYSPIPEDYYSWAYSQTVPEVGQWYHVVFQRTENQLEVWVNGVLDGVGSDPGWDIDIDADLPLIIGANRDHIAWFMDGMLDEVRIFDHSLSEQEIANLSSGQCGVSNVDDEPHEIQLLRGEYLAQCVPNPFNPQTTIFYRANNGQNTRLAVYDIAGRLVDVLVNEVFTSSSQREVVWNGRDQYGRAAAAGVYFYRLETGTYSETKRMVMVKVVVGICV